MYSDEREAFHFKLMFSFCYALPLGTFDIHLIFMTSAICILSCTIHSWSSKVVNSPWEVIQSHDVVMI